MTTTITKKKIYGATYVKTGNASRQNTSRLSTTLGKVGL